MTSRNLMQKKMTRKEFLISIGVLTLTVIGVFGFIDTFKKFGEPRYPVQSKGFGSSTYGGKTKHG